MNEKKINYTREAFLHPWNLGFLIGMMLLVFFTTGPDTFWDEALLIFTVASELLYLGTVPNMERFRRAVRSRKLAEATRPPSERDLFQQLNRSSQRRYLRLVKLKEAIAANYQRLSPASQGLLESHLKKIDDLLKSFLNLLSLKERHERFLQVTSEEDLTEAIEQLKEEIKEASPRVRAIKQRRMDILQKRLLRIQKAHENLEILEAQLATIEDVIQYIHEQSLTLRNPEELSFQLDTLLSETEETEALVQELEDIFNPPSLLDTLSLEEEELPSKESSTHARTKQQE